MPKRNTRIHPVEYILKYEDYDNCPICQKELKKTEWDDTKEWMIFCKECRFFIHFFAGSWNLRVGNFSTWVRFVNFYSKIYRQKHEIERDIKKVYAFYNKLIEKIQEHEQKKELDFFKE